MDRHAQSTKQTEQQQQQQIVGDAESSRPVLWKAMLNKQNVTVSIARGTTQMKQN